MSENNIKKLTLYCLDCVKSTSKNSDFVNLQKNKDNKVIITDLNEFEADNKNIIEIMTKRALNKTTMSIYKGFLILEGARGKDKFYSPLLYCEAELIREGDKIKLQYDEDDMGVNVGLIAALLDNNADIIENTINELLSIENPLQIDFKKVLSGLINNIEGMTITDNEALILAKTPDSVAGVINELKAISELY